jgi:CBASS immunity sensor of nucleotide second messenger signals
LVRSRPQKHVSDDSFDDKGVRGTKIVNQPIDYASVGALVSILPSSFLRLFAIFRLETPRESSGFIFAARERDVSGKDLAVLVSVAENVEPAFAQTQKSLPAFRAMTHVRHPREGRFDIASPGQATDIARTVIEAIRAAREKHRPLETVHLFMAVPLGVAMLIGQLLNTLGKVQTYEHVPTDGVGRYSPAALLHPSV